ncbi:chemotaxis protein CheB [Gemmatimonas sp.]|uniref:chemotaxis protein CheB n=1 Tax=Gemmatimonas sp. TaxID=1962908 RepID=UPI003982DED3
MNLTRPSYIVGVGGSAGALNAYKALLESLTIDTGMAFVIISHITPDAHSQLALILSRCSTMPTMVAVSGMPVRANHVYVIPANADLEIEQFTFKVISPRSRRNAQIDIFFSSVATAMGEYAIGIVLSGYDGDGTLGVQYIKEKGGTTFAQDDSAEVDGMPTSAQASTYIDFVLAPEKMGEALMQIGARFVRSD